ncbi:MAG: SnoaL-like domain [Thermoleophilaceae bacterium]|jgi:ketosteroid isomerase-like protein|nr:SnoaL-like domain [Thermoleophilaceae bacterium]
MDQTEIVRRAFQAFADRDREGLLAVVTPDVELHFAASELAGKPTMSRRLDYSGHAGVRAWLLEAEEDFSRVTLDPRHVQAVGHDTVLVLGTIVFDGRPGSGGMTAGWIARFRGERISRVEVHWDWSSARTAAVAV